MSVAPATINNFRVRLVRRQDGKIMAFVVEMIRAIYRLTNITQARKKWDAIKADFSGKPFSFSLGA